MVIIMLEIATGDDEKVGQDGNEPGVEKEALFFVGLDDYSQAKED